MSDMEVPRRLKNDVTEEMLESIAAAVDDAETRTTGEVHVHIVHDVPLLEKSRSHATRTFQRLGMSKTQQRNGVLLFVAMKQRKFEIVADLGIDGKVDPETWSAIARSISTTIHEDGFAEGVSRGVSKIGQVLAEHFPRRPDQDVDDVLPNRPSTS